jgi:hypothetical protein
VCVCVCVCVYSSSSIYVFPGVKPTYMFISLSTITFYPFSKQNIHPRDKARDKHLRALFVRDKPQHVPHTRRLSAPKQLPTVRCVCASRTSSQQKKRDKQQTFTHTHCTPSLEPHTIGGRVLPAHKQLGLGTCGRVGVKGFALCPRTRVEKQTSSWV